MAKVNGLFQDEQEKKAEEAYQIHLLSSDSPLSFEDFCAELKEKEIDPS